MATLTHPDPAANLSLAVDASNTHIGVVLQQWQPGGGRSGGWRPLSFFSKKLDAAQLKYSASTVHTQVQPIQLPVKRFSHVHIDIVGPLPASPGGCTHLLTMVDRSTRWAEAVPLVNTSPQKASSLL